MEKENTEELFSFKLNNEGAGHLMKLCRLLKFWIVFGIVFTFFVLVNDVLLLIRDSAPGTHDSLLKTYFILYPFLSLVTSVFFVLQLVAYWNFKRALELSIHNLDETGFNNSFEQLNRSVVFAIIVTSFSFVFIIFNLMFSLRFIFG